MRQRGREGQPAQPHLSAQHPLQGSLCLVRPPPSHARILGRGPRNSPQERPAGEQSQESGKTNGVPAGFTLDLLRNLRGRSFSSRPQPEESSACHRGRTTVPFCLGPSQV